MKYSSILVLTLFFPSIILASGDKSSLWTSCAPCHNAEGKLLDKYAAHSFNHDDVLKSKQHTIRNTLLDFGEKSSSPEDEIDIKNSSDVEAFEKILKINKDRRIENVALKVRQKELLRKLDITIEKSINEIVELRSKNKVLSTSLQQLEQQHTKTLKTLDDILIQMKSNSERDNTNKSKIEAYPKDQSTILELKNIIKKLKHEFNTSQKLLNIEISKINNEKIFLQEQLQEARLKKQETVVSIQKATTPSIISNKVTTPMPKTNKMIGTTNDSKIKNTPATVSPKIPTKKTITKNTDKSKSSKESTINFDPNVEIIFDQSKHKINSYKNSKLQHILVIEDVEGGKINGIMIEYFPDSTKIKRKGRIISGERDGVHQLFNLSGDEIFTQTFKNGAPVRSAQ